MTMPQFQRPTLAIQAGDLAPATHGMADDGAFYSFDAQAGRPAVVILFGRLALADGLSLLTAFQRRVADLSAREADVVALVDMQTPRAREYAEAKLSGPRIIFCEPDAFARWGFHGAEPAVVVIDRGARVVAVLDAADAAGAAEAALAAVAALPREAAQDVILPAPALLVPGVFSPAFCRELIAHFEASPHQVGGMAAIDAEGNAIHKIDVAKKHRHDFVLGPRDPYLGGVLNGLIRTVLPEIKKAFHIDACHTDRFVIARYDDAGGYFRRHRDNVAPDVAFRQFALSVNLNSDYEGGHVLFPEYNSHRYKPGTGAGVVFSCSLLHEAAPVTKGRRYVLLTFLHNAEAQARWLAGTAKRG